MVTARDNVLCNLWNLSQSNVEDGQTLGIILRFSRVGNGTPIIPIDYRTVFAISHTYASILRRGGIKIKSWAEKQTDFQGWGNVLAFRNHGKATRVIVSNPTSFRVRQELITIIIIIFGGRVLAYLNSFCHPDQTQTNYRWIMIDRKGPGCFDAISVCKQ